MSATKPYLTLAPLANLRKRAELLRQLRTFFDERSFVEVQTPVLSRDTVVDRHLDPWEVRSPELESWGFAQGRAFLQTSPEFAMKRLLASGMQKIYQVGPVFRGGERGRIHNPEFTMAEWYEAGASYDSGIVLLESLVDRLLGCGASQRVTYADLFLQHVGVDSRDASRDQLAGIAVSRGLVDRDSWSDDWDDWANLLFTELVQPNLGWNQPVTVVDFPASQSALAKLSSTDVRVAERFEIFVDGVELANGYHELTDAAELRNRNESVNRQRLRDGKSALPIESRMLQAMEDCMPPAAGCALGFDRVVMLACGARSIDQVLAFPIEIS